MLCVRSGVRREIARLLPIPKLVKREKLASVQKVRIMIIGAESAIIAPGKNSVIFFVGEVRFLREARRRGFRA